MLKISSSAFFFFLLLMDPKINWLEESYYRTSFNFLLIEAIRPCSFVTPSRMGSCAPLDTEKV